MRRVTPILIAAVLVLASLCVWLAFQVKQRGGESQQHAERERQAEDRYARAIADIASIQDSLDAITPLDAEGGMGSTSLDAEQRLAPSATNALARVAELHAGIDRARNRIGALETRLRQSGTQLAGLDKLLTRLKQDLAEREQMVASLTDQVDSLSTQVIGLSGSLERSQALVAAQESALEERRHELATVAYRIGDRKSLLADSVVTARGGLLGLGRTLVVTGKGDASAFQSFDTDLQRELPIAAAKATVLTAQTPASYRLEPSSQGMVLRILDPHEFRKVRRLIIVTE